MINDDWQPTQDDIDWTKQQINRMQIGDTWGIADAVLRKDSDALLTVLKASPASVMALARIGKVCSEFDVEVNAEEAEIIHDAQAAAQKSAEEWCCTNGACEERIVNFDLERAEWVMLDEEEQEAWRVVVSHETAKGETHSVQLSPMDYHLVAGDELFFSRNGLRVLERHEIIEMADEKTLLDSLTKGEVFIMPTELTTFEDEHSTTETIPPHLRGLIFKTNQDVVVWDEEE